MVRVLVSDTLSEQGLAILKSGTDLEVEYRPGLSESELCEAVRGVTALVVRSASKVTARVLESANALKVIGRAGIGVDNVDVPTALRRGVVVMNTPTGNAITTAEHAIALLMSIARMIPEASRTLKAGKWEKKKFQGRELAGKTLGVIGLGNIGRLVADRAKGLHMNVIGVDPVIGDDAAAALGVELVSLDELWERADAVTVHTPLTPQTKGLVSSGMLGKLKKGVLLVNAARGGIYDESALLEGLESGRIGGVALDVFTQEPPPADMPLLAHERVVVTPHIGASTKEAQDRVALEIAQQIVAYLDHGEIKNAVNAPAVSRESAQKLAPYITLAERLGRFLAQVGGGRRPKVIEVECVGSPAEPGAITASAAAGFLADHLRADVNQISALQIARDHGVIVRQTQSSGPRGKHALMVIVRVEAEDGAVAVAHGTLGSDGAARLVRWGEFELEARLGGPTLVVTSLDKLGVVGFIGTTLGSAAVNVSRVFLGSAGGGLAMSVWNLDHEIPAAALDELRRSANIQSALSLLI